MGSTAAEVLLKALSGGLLVLAFAALAQVAVRGSAREPAPARR